MQSILVLGAGFVAAPLVDYLNRQGYEITIASHLLQESEALAAKFNRTHAIQLDVSDTARLRQTIGEHSIIVSFVPFIFHEAVAEACIAEQRSLVTASYETSRMRDLDEQAKLAGITIINEIGLDPGIDHLSARKIFDEIHQAGEKLESFVSWCGGLPAPSANTNPLGYKFSWSPKSVLLALLNEAKYINNNVEELIPAEQLLLRTDKVKLSEDLILEGYANRDSTSYVASYDIPEASKVLRGTLRYPGFCEIMQLSKTIGLLDQTDDLLKSWQNKSWFDYMLNQADSNEATFRASLSELQLQAFEYLGLMDRELTIKPAATILDAFCELLTQKLAFTEGESDMVVMQHQLRSINDAGQHFMRTSTLILEGEANGYSAMAKTVGTPVAIMVDMILTKEFTHKGVHLPMTSEFYEPMLQRLAAEGIEMQEDAYPI